MESKLKSLKVIELKDILVKAAVTAPAKANKADLISRILANPAAIDEYNRQYPPATNKQPTATSVVSQNDDLLAPPEDFDWNADDTTTLDSPVDNKAASATQALSTKELSIPAPKPNAPSTANATPASMTATLPPPSPSPPPPPVLQKSISEDSELEKRRQRAARFGIPLVETPKARAPNKPYPSKPAQAHQRVTETKPATNLIPSSKPQTTPTPEDLEKLKARAARFGLPANGTLTNVRKETLTGQKRPAPPQQVDPEELERRRKRAERFGNPPVGTIA